MNNTFGCFLLPILKAWGITRRTLLTGSDRYKNAIGGLQNGMDQETVGKARQGREAGH